MRRLLPRALRILALFTAFGIASWLAMHLHGGGLWDGLTPAVAGTADPKHGHANYDLRQLKVVNEVLKAERRQSGSPVSLPIVRSKRPGTVALDNAAIYDIAFP